MVWTIGDVRITKVIEMEQHVELAGMIPAATIEALEPHAEWLRPHFLDHEGGSNLSIHAFVIESGGRRILVDTCVGDRVVEGVGELRGDPAFLDRLLEAGFAPESIDVVCCTHLHFDHVGWNTRLVDGEWVPTFPNARYLFCRDEYDATMADPGFFALNLPDTVAPILEAGLADLVDPDHRVDEHVRLTPTPGHSPGHVSVVIESGDATAFITGDMSHHPVQWAEIDWGFAGDHDAALAAATRRKVLADLGDTGAVVLGTHFAPPTAGHLVTRDGSWIFEATTRTEWS